MLKVHQGNTPPTTFVPQELSANRAMPPSALPRATHRKLIPLILAMSAAALEAQSISDPNLHGWFSYIGDHQLGSSKFGLHLEEQWRRHDLVMAWQQNLPRAGLTYRVNPKLQLAAGYGYITTYRYGDSPLARSFPESRLWYDARFTHKVGRFTILNRARFENRWLEFRQRDWQYENRLRHMLRVNRSLGTAGWYAGVYDEYFVPIRPHRNPNDLDQNRAAFVLGKQVHPHWRVEAGYMHQAVWQRNARWREDNHTFVFTVTSSKPFRR